MRRAWISLTLFALSAGAENLLKNPSFEVLSNGAPADWSVFVQPKPGASSFLDQRVAKDGSNSVKLSIDSPYIEDPANNWSQNVLADVRGKRLRLTGSIKTENAAEAAIWVQCYRRGPLKLLSQESTSSKGLLTGTNDWTPVELSIDVPQDSDFVVVRCVLRFRGVAWFDALSLVAEAAAPPAAPALPGQTPAIKMPTLPSMPPVPEVKPSDAERKPPTPNEIVQAHEELRKVNWQLRQSNTELLKQMEELRQQIEALKKQIADTQAAAQQLKSDQPQSPDREKPVELPPPPLVPNETQP